MRADICQNILLDIYEGNTSLEELYANRDKMRFFVAKYHRQQQPSQEVNGLYGGIDDRPFDEIVAARQFADVQREGLVYSFVQPTQIDTVYAQEVNAITYGLVQSGIMTNREFVEQDIESGHLKIRDFNKFRLGHINKETNHLMPNHARKRFEERFGIVVDDDRAKKICAYCEARKPERIRDDGSERHEIRWNGKDGVIVYRRKTNTIVTVIITGRTEVLNASGVENRTA